ncbi:MAG: hypothetical protein K0Q59_4916, partial [Paenibacillus sp.]|nr:hypothetical protein [Paenibacillus sp.]
RKPIKKLAEEQRLRMGYFAAISHMVVEAIEHREITAKFFDFHGGRNIGT